MSERERECVSLCVFESFCVCECVCLCVCVCLDYLREGCMLTYVCNCVSLLCVRVSDCVCISYVWVGGWVGGWASGGFAPCGKVVCSCVRVCLRESAMCATERE